MAQPSIAFVEINTPMKNQQVPLGIILNISGTSEDNKLSKCKITIVVNNEFPYRETHPIGNFGHGDYSKWSFVLTSEYTKLNLGENKITSKAYAMNITTPL